MPEVVRWHLKTLNIMATPLHEEIQKFYEEEEYETMYDTLPESYVEAVTEGYANDD